MSTAPPITASAALSCWGAPQLPGPSTACWGIAQCLTVSRWLVSTLDAGVVLSALPWGPEGAGAQQCRGQVTAHVCPGGTAPAGLLRAQPTLCDNPHLAHLSAGQGHGGPNMGRAWLRTAGRERQRAWSGPACEGRPLSL